MRNIIFIVMLVITAMYADEPIKTVETNVEQNSANSTKMSSTDVSQDATQIDVTDVSQDATQIDVTDVSQEASQKPLLNVSQEATTKSEISANSSKKILIEVPFSSSQLSYLNLMMDKKILKDTYEFNMFQNKLYKKKALRSGIFALVFTSSAIFSFSLMIKELQKPDSYDDYDYYSNYNSENYSNVDYYSDEACIAYMITWQSFITFATISGITAFARISKGNHHKRLANVAAQRLRRLEKFRMSFSITPNYDPVNKKPSLNLVGTF